jgi:uncharacterized protein (DUF362 family)
MDRISVIHDPSLGYPAAAPFHPSQNYPEYPWKQFSSEPNGVYAAIRNNLIQLGLDQDHINSPEWNPFIDFIKPGDCVLVKPNFVLHFNASGNDLSALVTHPSVIRAALDYVKIALKNRGSIIIGDAPVQSCRIEDLLASNGLLQVIEFFRENSCIEIEFRDLREEVIRLEKHSLISSRRKNPVDITEVRLGANSKLEGIIQDLQLFYVDGYEQSKTVQSHAGGTHLYDLHSLTYQVDAIINIPKLKTHKKAGMTGAIKNFVGLNANKYRLPHFRSGSPAKGGDEYPLTNGFREVYSVLFRKMDRTDNKTVRYLIVSVLYIIRMVFKLQKFHLVEGGAWPGNDTLWRMVHDLTRVIYFRDKQGLISPQIQRKVFQLVDGVVAGESMGPLRPSPKQAGLIISGFNPFLVDAAACALMGFDYRKVKSVIGMQDLFPVEPADARVCLNGDAVPFDILGRQIAPAFVPPYGWDEIVAK